MSNRRRKRIGQEKLRANRMIRVVRGARKAGTPLPGFGAWRIPWIVPHETIKEKDKTYHVDEAGRVLVGRDRIVAETEELRRQTIQTGMMPNRDGA